MRPRPFVICGLVAVFGFDGGDHPLNARLDLRDGVAGEPERRRDVANRAFLQHIRAVDGLRLCRKRGLREGMFSV